MLTSGQPNILVDDYGNARIADFGFTTVTRNSDSMGTVSCHHGNTPRWTAPEVLKEGPYSKEADIFAFAMVMIEVRHRRSSVYRALANCRLISIQVFTGAVPFRNESSFTAALSIMKDKRPLRPEHPTLTDDLWTLIQRCWNRDPHLRPGVSEVLQALVPSVLYPFLRSYLLNSTAFSVCSEHLVWEQSTDRSPATHDRVSLITAIFLDDSQVEKVRQLSGDDAQNLIDIIDGVSPRTISSSKNKLVDFDSNFHIFSIRYWIASHRRSAGGVCAICTRFATNKPCFRDHCKFHFVTIQRGTRCVMVDRQTCGRVDTLARRSQPRS